MKSVQSLIASLIVLLPAATLPADDIANWKTYPLIRHQDLTVNLRVQPKATLADEQWIAIEFINQGSSPIKVKDANYQMKRTDRDFGGQPSLSGGYNRVLFPKALAKSPAGRMVIPTGTYRVIEQPSTYSSALLGLAPKRGQRIKAQIHFVLWLDDGTKIDTRGEPMPFDFKWLRPDMDGLARIRARLKHMVANPNFVAHNNTLLGALLRIDEVSNELTLPESLTGLDKFGSMISGRDGLARFVDRRFPNDPALIAYLDERLRQRDTAVLYEMTYMPNTWDDRLLDPLLSKFEGSARNWRLVMMVLELHDSPHKSNAEVARRLTRAIVASGGLSDSSVNSSVKKYGALRMLGRTHDSAALKHLKPLLDDKNSVPIDSVAVFTTEFPLFRVCDVALEAALMLLDGDAGAIHPNLGSGRKRLESIVEKVSKHRDELIVKVKKRIDDQ